MAQIKLDREKKIILLQALQRGTIESEVLQGWHSDGVAEMTDEELKEQICKIDFSLYPDNCKNRIANGLCYIDNGRTDYPNKYNEIRRERNKPKENNTE